MKKNIVLLLLIFTLVESCKKDKTPVDDLPPATQMGANTFACKVNGSNWIAKNYRSNILGYVSRDTLVISGANPETTVHMEIFFIRIYQFVNGQQNYKLNDTSKVYAEFVTNKNCFSNSGGFGVGSGKSHDGELSLSKVDKINKTVSGTFWFNIKTDNCDTLKISDGRFDINYN